MHQFIWPALQVVFAVVLASGAIMVQLQQLPVLECDESQVVLEFSFDGKYLATSTPVEHRYSISPSPPPSPNPLCTRIQVWDVASRKCLLTIKENGARIRHLGFTPTGQYLAETIDSQADKQTITRHDLTNGTSKEVCQLPASDRGVYSPLTFRLSPDHTTLYVSERHRYYSEKRLMLWNADSGELLLTHYNLEGEFWFSPSRKSFDIPLCIPMQKTHHFVIRSFDLNSKETTHSPKPDDDTLKKMMPPWSFPRWVCSPDERFLVFSCVGWSGVVDRTKDGAEGYLTTIRSGEHDTYHFSADSKYLFLYGQRTPRPKTYARCLDVYSLPDVKKIASHELAWHGSLVGPWLIEWQDIVGDVRKNENSELLIVYDAVTGKEQTRFLRNDRAGHRLVKGPILQIPGRSSDWLAYYHFEPGTAFLVFRNVVTGEVERLPAEPSCTDSIAFSRDGTKVAVPMPVKEKVPPRIAIHSVSKR